MNLQQLEYLISLGQYRHFGKAAEHCNVTQPTLSTMIQKLEEELQVKLFDRSRQPIQPTYIGEKVIHQAQEILKAAGRVKEVIQEERSALEGSIFIGVLPTIAPYLLPRIIPLVDELLPKLRITFVELQTNQCIEELESGYIQLAIVGSEGFDDNIKMTPLYYEEFFGYISENEELYNKESIRSSEVSGKHLWLLDEGHCFRNQLEKFCMLRKSAGRRFGYNRGNLETFMHFVEQGNGLTFIPELCSLSLSKEKQRYVRPFTIPRPTRLISMIEQDDFVRVSIRNALVDIIRQAVPQDMLDVKVGQRVV